MTRELHTGFGWINSASRTGKAMGALAVALVLVFGAIAAPVPAEARSAPESFADIAEDLIPAVVNISTTQTVSVGDSGMEGLDELFRDLIPPDQRQRTSLGSGFVIDPGGIIVTNNHVIEDADAIEVSTIDGQKFDAEVVGRDPQTDIAVLRVNARNLPSVRFGNSDEARVGDWVIAIGNPFNLGGTVTAGIISARNREIGGRYDDYIQTDASINRGNSGGPLFNLEGEVIGVNTAIFSQTGGSIGIGFSVPSSLAGRIVSQILEYGETRRGWLGVTIQEVTPEIAEIAGLDEPLGAMVSGFADNSPAEEGGIERGDIIVEFDNRPVDSIRDLVRIVADTDIGRTVPVDVIRDGERRTVRVTVAQMEEPNQVSDRRGSDAPSERQFSSGEEEFGVTLSRLTPNLRKRFNLPDDVEGVVVLQVQPDLEVAEKLQPGDVIVEVGQREVEDPEEAFERIEAERQGSDNRPVLLLINRGGVMQFVGVRVENSRNN